MTEKSLDEFIEQYPPEIRILVMETRGLIQNLIPNVVEMVDPPSHIVAYGFGPKNADLICAIAPYTKYINLIFSRGATLPDPDGRLKGAGKRARHLKIQSSAEIESASTKTLIEEALRAMG